LNLGLDIVNLGLHVVNGAELPRVKRNLTIKGGPNPGPRYLGIILIKFRVFTKFVENRKFLNSGVNQQTLRIYSNHT
jgi:hypothetical protein